MGQACETKRNTNQINASLSNSQNHFILNKTYTISSNNTSYNNNKNNFNDPKYFPKGEYYFPLIKDSNLSTLFENKNNNWQSEKIEIFFSLINIVNTKNLYSFSFTIINNSRLGIESYLGDLEHSCGKNIYFGTSFIVDYYYERKQSVLIGLIVNNYKMDNKINFFLNELIENPNKTKEINIQNVGILKIEYISLKNNNNINKKDLSRIISNFKFNITLFKLINNTFPNLFFIISHTKDMKRRPVYKSSEFNTNNIVSNVIKIEADNLCKDYNDKIYVEIYSYQHFPIFIAQGSFNLSLLEKNILKNSKQTTEIQLYNMNQEHIGYSTIQYYEKKKISYLDKLFNNEMQINLEIAIDYTKSNKPPNDPSSNHYLKGMDLNDYEKAIKSCCEVLAPYDADQLFPVYGFGGIPSLLNGIPNKTVSHCFNINFQENPEIHGIDNILNCYRKSLSMVELSGNTKFSFILNKVINNINHDLRYKKNENHYYILLILTDGVVNDLRDTIDLIVEGSSLPLSIVIVGIGNEDFDFMERLDGDEVPLINSQGVKRKRDIVQFIKFNIFKKNNAINIGTDFAEEVLKEIPKQIDEYYNYVGKFY